MKAVSLKQPGQFEWVSVPDPVLTPGHVLVRVRRIGVCGTDLHAFHGDQPFFEYPRILGHELGVEVFEVGDGVTDLSPGDRCSVEPYIECGECIACRRGRTNCCATLKVLGVHVDGGMCSTLSLPEEKLHRSAIMSLDQLALVETLGIGAHAVDRASLEAGENVLVIGVGPIGLSVIQFAQVAGANVIALDVSDSRLAFCQQHLGVPHVVNVKEDVLARLNELTGNDLPTTVFDATGNPNSMKAAFEFVAPSGQLVFVGLCQADISFHDPHLHRREITIKASRNATPDTFTRIIELIEAGKVDTSPWITHRADFDAMMSEFESWTQPSTGVVKAMIDV